jgi:hypothetical protein
MDLVAGDAREILLAIGVEDWTGLADPRRFEAHLPLRGRVDPSWLDLLAQAVRDVAGGDEPGPFSEACLRLDDRRLGGLGGSVDRTVERVDPRWVDDMAMVPDRAIDAVAARWIELISLEECAVEADDKPVIRVLVEDLIDFCRRSQAVEDVLLAWSL